MAKYTYYYFNGRGRAETTRLIFAASGTAYEDKRIPQEEWPTLKPKMPFGTLPVLEVDGQMIPQSIAIARYAARTTGLAGKTDIDQAQIEAITDLLTELREDGLIAAFTKEKDKQADLMTALKEKVPKYLKLLEGKMTKGQFLYGSSLTWADLHFYAVMECLAGPVPDALKEFPKLQDLQKRVAELPNVAKYLKDRPETPF